MSNCWFCDKVFYESGDDENSDPSHITEKYRRVAQNHRPVYAKKEYSPFIRLAMHNMTEYDPDLLYKELKNRNTLLYFSFPSLKLMKDLCQSLKAQKDRLISCFL